MMPHTRETRAALAWALLLGTIVMGLGVIAWLDGLWSRPVQPVRVPPPLAGKPAPR